MSLPALIEVGNVDDRTLRLDPSKLVLDPALQCRVQMDAETIEEYAEAMAEGAVFPPVEVIEVDGQLLVVDGWHRVRAARRVAKSAIVARVRQGTRKEALLAAVAANAQHGLRRSRDDKRRAVRVLLCDHEFCGLSSREAGKLAGVSHAFVSKERVRFGVKTGEVLDPEHVARVEGELPPEWKALVDEHEHSWEHRVIEVIRTARDLPDLAKASKGYGREYTTKALALRLAELATTPWQWGPETGAERRTRAAGLDTLEDLVAAMLAKDCPDRLQLFDVWNAARGIGRVTERWTLAQLRERLAGRPGLLQAVEARAEKLGIDADEPRRPWAIAEDLVKMPDVEARCAAIRTCSGEVLTALCNQRLAELDTATRQAVRLPLLDAATRQAVRDRLGDRTAPCTMPRCSGWMPLPDRDSGSYVREQCMDCGASRRQAESCRAHLVESVRSLLAGDIAVELGDGVRLDDKALALLQLVAQLPMAAFAEHPEALHALVVWRRAGQVKVLVDVRDEAAP